MIELVVVLAIISGLSLLAVPRIVPVLLNDDSAAREIEALFLTTRRAAIVQARPLELCFIPSSGAFRVSLIGGEDLQRGALAHAVQLTGQRRIACTIFLPDGQTAGQRDLQFILTDGSDRLALSIDAWTGAITHE